VFPSRGLQLRLQFTMGFNSTAIRFFLASKPFIPEMTNTLTLGRQSFTPTLWMLGRLKREKLISTSKRLTYADDFFRCSGVKRLDCLDFSAYEGANILHDLGDPIPSELHAKYDLVIDAGTLEHVPDFLSALKNTMAMVKVGGTLMIIAPANNFLGHGCYQLSPEIFHRVLSMDQGFKIKVSYLHEDGPFGGRWRNVQDSKVVNTRVSINTKRATFICILAARVSLKKGVVGNQSDYENLWNETPNISKLGSAYLRSPYFLQRIAYLLVLKRMYAKRSKKTIQKIRTSGFLRLPHFHELDA